MPKSRCLLSIALTLFAWAFVTPVSAADENTGPLRIIVSAPAGSAPDVVARMLAEQWQRQGGRPVLVDNKPGANGVVAINAFKTMPADGNTLLMAQAGVVAVTPLTYKAADYDMERDFEAIVAVAETPILFVTHPAAPFKSLGELIAKAKAAPDQYAIVSTPRGTGPHLAAELLSQLLGRSLRIVPASNAQVLQAVVNREADVGVDGITTLLPMVRTGRLQALAVSAQRRLPGLEDLPLASASLPGLNLSGWYMLFAPKNTPPARVAAINGAVNQALRAPELVMKMQNVLNYPMGGSVADTRNFLAREKRSWAAVVQQSGLQPE